jgi:hypothetical protein
MRTHTHNRMRAAERLARAYVRCIRLCSLQEGECGGRVSYLETNSLAY